MTEEVPSLPTARVATRPGGGGVAEKRRRIYQRHFLLFLAVCVALIAADSQLSPGIQWAHFLAFPWLLVFALHTVGLLSRGYSVPELLIPPREKPVKEVYTTPLDYELVRSRQLRDGIAAAAGALRDKDAALVEKAVAAADELVNAMEGMVASARNAKYRQEEQANNLAPDAQAALQALDGLHQGLLKVEVLEESTESVPVQAVEQQARTLQRHSD